MSEPKTTTAWYEAWKQRNSDRLEVKITHVDTGIAWAGFWIGLGIMLAAAVMKGTLVIHG